MEITEIKTFEEYANDWKKYDGGKCFIAGCDKPAYYEGGDARFYCGMCEEHSRIRVFYHGYLLDCKRHIETRIKWSKDDPMKALHHRVCTLLAEEFIYDQTKNNKT